MIIIMGHVVPHTDLSGTYTLTLTFMLSSRKPQHVKITLRAASRADQPKYLLTNIASIMPSPCEIAHENVSLCCYGYWVIMWESWEDQVNLCASHGVSVHTLSRKTFFKKTSADKVIEDWINQLPKCPEGIGKWRCKWRCVPRAILAAMAAFPPAVIGALQQSFQ